MFKFYIEQRKDAAFYHELKEWLTSSCSNTWYYSCVRDTISFVDKEDAMMFKLKYDGKEYVDARRRD